MMLLNDFDLLATKKMSKAGDYGCVAQIGVL